MVLLDFSIVPLGRGQSVSVYVARCLDIIDRSGLNYRLQAMGTVIEGEIDQVLNVLHACFDELQTDCDRITCTAKFDYRSGNASRLNAKIQSVEKRLGRELRTGE